ncbi:hypothetical protein [Fictibacillus phosphorivorans]|uniref:hypothetical protein n=1 Tax=Fictibacillus phosphorivorans TaxID=1221500 RepID=UPI00203A67DA|nr:hypothetical protein [Fictibacillus phosphorivorans]MCM3719802.1 hypothetical protein [Fictibacillus phosphorivorans]MCM3777527.1 hypothetical protein [Fictibacillus phosphorivorans]
MLSIKTLPSNIERTLNDFNKGKEKPDVFPSAFLINDEKFYYFTFNPSAEKLIINQDGSIKPISEVTYPALIANGYYTAIRSILNGQKWVKASTKSNYIRLKKTLLKIQKELPKSPKNLELVNSLGRFIHSANEIVELQNVIEKAVKDGIKKVQSTNSIGIVTKDDFDELRAINLKMVRAAYRQNKVQIETEDDRHRVYEYLNSKSFFSNIKLGLYNIQLMPFKKYMLRSETNMGQEILEMGYVMDEDVPLEEHPNAQEVLDQYKNPRR